MHRARKRERGRVASQLAFCSSRVEFLWLETRYSLSARVQVARSHRRENFSTTDRWRSFNYSDHLSATVPPVVSIVSEDSKFLSPFHALISPLDHFSLSTSASFLSSPHGFASFSRIRNSTDANLLILAMIFFEFYQFRPLIRDFYHF